MSLNDSLLIRPAQESDLNLILSSWLKEYRYAPFTKGIESKLYYKHHKELILSLLASSQCQVICQREDLNAVLGYMVFSYDTLNNLIIHYLYIKNTFRKLGFGRTLVQNAILPQHDLIIFATHFTKWLKLFIDGTKLPITYHPYLLLNGTK